MICSCVSCAFEGNLVGLRWRALRPSSKLGLKGLKPKVSFLILWCCTQDIQGFRISSQSFESIFSKVMMRMMMMMMMMLMMMMMMMVAMMMMMMMVW